MKFSKYTYLGNITEMKIIPTVEMEVMSIIRLFKPNNLSGYDEVSSRILKHCASVISKPLNSICN
jgi:hypothetical protein